jgi:hypothetical protein
MTAPTSARLTIDDGLHGCLVLCVVCVVWGRDKLSRVKAEKKLLVKELRALRDLGLYEGPLTYSDTGPAKPYDTAAALEREEVHDESAPASSALRDEKPEAEGGGLQRLLEQEQDRTGTSTTKATAARSWLSSRSGEQSLRRCARWTQVRNALRSNCTPCTSHIVIIHECRFK